MVFGEDRSRMNYARGTFDLVHRPAAIGSLTASESSGQRIPSLKLINRESWLLAMRASTCPRAGFGLSYFLPSTNPGFRFRRQPSRGIVKLGSDCEDAAGGGLRRILYFCEKPGHGNALVPTTALRASAAAR